MGGRAVLLAACLVVAACGSPDPALPTDDIAAGVVSVARDHVSASAVLTDVRSGPFRSVFVVFGDDAGSGQRIDPATPVWIVTFSDTFEICPPDGSACFPPRAGRIEVVLEYATRRFLFSSSFAPDPG